MANLSPLVLIVEPDESLAELNKLILEGDGYRVIIPPNGANILTFIAQTHPDVIVLAINGETSPGRDILTHLQSNPHTRDIPVVVVASDEYLVALAKTVPVTSASLVHPYQVQELLAAIARALHNPPPAAVLPPPRHPPSPVISFATEELEKHERRIVIQTVSDIQGFEPQHSRFAESLPDLIDNLAKMLAAINQGLRRSLAPTEVFAVPSIQRSIEEHVRSRKHEGIDAGSTIREYQILALRLSQFLAGLVEQGHLTIHDYFPINRDVQVYADELIVQVIRHFGANDQDSSNPSTRG